MSEKKRAKAEAAASKEPATDQGFDSLTDALDGSFEKNLDALPELLHKRVEREFFPHLWDSLSPEQRKQRTLQLDYQNDPAMEQDRKYWWNFFARKYELEKQITEWKNTETPTASDLAVKETRLSELQQELERMEKHQRQGRGDYYPEKKALDDNNGIQPGNDFIAYPKAIKILYEKWKATPEEMAVWIFLGPETGGISAYLNANELSPPPPFSYAYYVGSDDYLSPLMFCWFQKDDIDRFEPADHYITGIELIDRWSKIPGLQPRAFINAKISESRLLDFHPICGGTRGTFDEQENFPPLETGLFAISHIEQIEAEDFDLVPELPNPVMDSDPIIIKDKGGRPKEIFAEAVEKAYLYFLEKGELTILKRGNVRSFLKEFKSLADDGQYDSLENRNIRTYLAERIKSIKIPRHGECLISTQDRDDGQKNVYGPDYTQQDISKQLTKLRKKYPLPQ